MRASVILYALLRDYPRSEVLATPSCPVLCDLMDWSPPGSSVHGILQARILEWAAILFSRWSSWPRDPAWVSCIAGRFFYHWARVILYTLFKDYPTPTLKKKPTSLQWPLRSSAFWCFIIWLHYLLLSVCSHSSSQLGPCLSFNAQAHSYLRGFVRLLPPLNAFHTAFPAS